MSYKPKHCCECGDRIERANWGFLASRRFCELCETNFRHLDWIPKISLAAAALLTIFSFGNFFRKPEKPLLVAAVQSSGNFADSNRNAVSSPSVAPPNGNSAANQTTNTNSAAQPKPKPIAVVKPAGQSNLQENKSETAQEAVYFCGAQTKKGTPCTRRVKGGGRCWQHAGQAAMLTPEKLIAN